MDNISMLLPQNYTKLTQPQRRMVREAYIRKQDGQCYHCGHDLQGPPSDEMLDLEITPRLYPDGFFTHPIHLHHNHFTQMTIGAVHCHCNAVLWEHHGE